MLIKAGAARGCANGRMANQAFPLTSGLLAAFLLAACGPVQAQNLKAGARIAETHCARCHAIGRKGSSPLPKATPFRLIHEKYPVEQLEEAFGEGVTSNHLGMPDFDFTPAEVMNLLGYIKSLTPRRAKR